MVSAMAAGWRRGARVFAVVVVYLAHALAELEMAFYTGHGQF